MDILDELAKCSYQDSNQARSVKKQSNKPLSLSKLSSPCDHYLWRIKWSCGFLDHGFHNAPPIKHRQMAVMQTKEGAMNEMRKAVGMNYGIGWDEVVEGGHLEVLWDFPKRYVIQWSPPDSQMTTVDVTGVFVTGNSWIVEIKKGSLQDGQVLGPFEHRQTAVDEAFHAVTEGYEKNWEKVQGTMKVCRDETNVWEALWGQGMGYLKCQAIARIIKPGENVSIVENSG